MTLFAYTSVIKFRQSDFFGEGANITVMRIVFMGTPDFAVPTLQILIDHHELVGVVTQPDRAKGRGQTLTAPPVKQLATQQGIPVWQPEKIRQSTLPQA